MFEKGSGRHGARTFAGVIADADGTGRPTKGLSRGSDLPALCGPHVWLRPVEGPDLQALYRFELSGGSGTQWRLHGATPSPEQHARSVWENVLAIYSVAGRDSGRTLGVVSLYSPSMENGVAFLAVASLPVAMGTGLVLEGAALFIDHCFAMWNLRKILIDTVETSLHHFGSVSGRVFVEEGRLKEIQYANGRHWDRVFLSLDRSDWQQKRQSLLPFAFVTTPHEGEER